MNKSTWLVWTYLLLIAPYCPASEKATIAVIESYHSKFLWDESYNKGLQYVLKPAYTIVNFQMDTKRLPKSQHQKKADQAWQFIQQIKPVVVVLGDDNALAFLGPKLGQQTFIPTVYLGINSNPRDTGISKYKNITGVLERPVVKRAIQTIKKITPVRRVLVLFDGSNTSKVMADYFERGKSEFNINDVYGKLMLVETIEEWKQLVSSAENHNYDAIFIGLHHTLVNKNKQHIPSNEVISWTSTSSSIPIFAFWDFSIGKGKAIGGYVVDGFEQGWEAGKIVKRILKGEKPSTIHPVINRSGLYLFSKSELKRWGLIIPKELIKRAMYVD